MPAGALSVPRAGFTAAERASEPGVEAAPLQGEARLRELVTQNHEFIWRSMRRLGVGEADADDATQQVFMVASRRLAEIEPSKERSFLFGTALRVASEHRRSVSRRRESPEAATDDVGDPAPDPEEAVERARRRELLDGMLGELELELRTVFVLFELEEMSAPEIAVLIEIPIGTVASRLRRAREEFRLAVKRWRARESFHGRDT